MTRIATTFAIALSALTARADELLLMPTAHRLPSGILRGEIWGYNQLSSGSLACGLGQNFEAQLSIDRFGRDPGRPTASLAYYYLTPIADITPGLCGGVLDAANETTDGRRLYVCASMNRTIASIANLVTRS